MPDPKVVSLDIETYGCCETTHDERPLPLQRMFHPRRSLLVDKVAPEDLILSCALTLPECDPRSGGGWDAESLKALKPGKSMLLEMWKPAHRRILQHWLKHVDTISGMNLPYDFTYLRHFSEFRGLLTERRITILDASVFNFSHSEVRPERSLKDIGPILGAYMYERRNFLKEGNRFGSPLLTDFRSYNMQDSHNSFLAISTLAGLIERDYPCPDEVGAGPQPPIGGCSWKLAPFAINYWSDVLWLAIRMMEAGTPMRRAALEKIEKDALAQVEAAETECRNYNLILKGKGSPASRTALMEFLFKEIDKLEVGEGLDTEPKVKKVLGVDSIFEHPLANTTDVTEQVSTTYANRQLAREMLPPDHTAQSVLKAWRSYTTNQGNISKFTYPLLRHARAEKSKNPYASILLPQPGYKKPPPWMDPQIWLTYSKWYVTPSPFKDDRGGHGGQKQARPASQSPCIQQFPALIKTAIDSRFEGGSVMAPDLSQIELRTAALKSGDQSLIENYRLGLNLHRDRAIYVFGAEVLDNPYFKTGDNENDPYQWAKTLNFEDLYMAGAEMMQTQMLEASGRLFPLSFFYEIQDSRPILRPGLVEWQTRIIDEANAQGYLILPFTGHSRLFTGGTAANKPNEMVNFPIQTTAAITMYEILRRVQKRLPSLALRNPPIYYCINWYDAVYFDCSPSYKEEFIAIYDEAVRYVERQGYWSWHIELSGNEVPLKYEMKELNVAA